MDTHNVQREEIESVYGKISPFEFRNRLISLARGQKGKSVLILLDAGRGNPPSVAMKPESISYLKEIVTKYNKNLIIVSDDVYGTFVENFCSLVSNLPFNTIGVYSFSKYFGVTGWRLGTIALQEDNVFDKLLKELPDGKNIKAKLRTKSSMQYHICNSIAVNSFLGVNK